MTRAALAEARAFESWQDYQEALKRAIAPLSEEQLQRRLLPTLRTPREIAEHIVYGRALWLHRTLGERAVELTPLIRWEDADDPLSSELPSALDTGSISIYNRTVQYGTIIYRER
jgi:uncharacterized damage-inducible protein DinB